MAVSTWNGRISPVFDVSRRMVVLEIDQGTIQRKQEESLDEDPGRKIEQISRDGIQVLICGAISQSIADLLVVRGVRIIPFITGAVEEVIQAYLSDQLHRPRFVMAGCCGHHRRRRSKRCGNTRLR